MLKRNVTLNLAGQALPVLIALIAIPKLIAGIGTERFGILTLAWVVVGYFSLFDLGMGRALTKLVAENIGKGDSAENPQLIWTSLALMTAVGVIGALGAAILSPWLAGSALNIPTEMREETRSVFLLLSLGVPVVILVAGLFGVLEAYQRFDLINAVRVPMGAITFLGPLVVLPFSHSLVAMVATLVAGRVILLVVLVLVCRRSVPGLREGQIFKRMYVRQLLGYGGWLTVSNIVGPLMLYADRFFIAGMLSVREVAHYTMPFELIIRLLIVPAAVMGVYFPALSESYGKRDGQMTALYHMALKIILLLLVPVVIGTLLFARQGMTLWLNEEFARHSVVVAHLLVVAILINSCGHVSQAVVQAAGRPDITAKLHLAELVLYVTYLPVLITYFGIIGAACAWLVRVTISAVVLAILAQRSLPSNLSKSL